MARKWTVLVYLAADNDLDPFAQKDLHEMERVGSSDEIALVVMVDFRRLTSDGKAKRGLVKKNPNWQQFASDVISVFEEVGSVNTGDPKVLSDFIAWGVRNYPADHYGLVIWGHGSGWKPDFIYQAAEKVTGSKFTAALQKADFATKYESQVSRLLFRPTLDEAVDGFIHQSLIPSLPKALVSPAFSRLEAAKLASGFNTKLVIGNAIIDLGDIDDVLSRAIAFDETSHQGLDSKALKTALVDGATAAGPQNGKPFVWDFLGFDACMMAGIETCYQISELAEVVIGSEEIEPGRGWRYDLLLESVQSLPVTGFFDTLGKALVSNYIKALEEYRIRLVTQSSARLSSMNMLVDALDRLAQELQPLLDTRYQVLAKAEKTSTRFFDKDYIDIGNYIVALKDAADTSGFRAALDGATQAYQSTLISSQFAFPNPNQNPTGLSIYYPAKPAFDQSYQTLEIAGKLVNWINFIKKYHFLT